MSELLPGTVTVEKKDMRVSAGHKALPTMLLCDMEAHSAHLTREKSAFYKPKHNAPKCAFIPNV